MTINSNRKESSHKGIIRAPAYTHTRGQNHTCGAGVADINNVRGR